MRNSDRRKLLSRMHCADLLTTSKSQVAHVKLLANNGAHMNAYTFDRNPLLFEIDGDTNLYPTVYFCWAYPEAFPTILVHEPVFMRLQNGADLMLPGVVYKRGEFPEFNRNFPVAISVITADGSSVKGPVGVGVSLMSSMEMLASGMQGRGVQILHLYRDLMWEFGDRSHPPQTALPQVFVRKPLSEEDFPELGAKLTIADEKKPETAVTEPQENGQGASVNSNDVASKQPIDSKGSAESGAIEFEEPSETMEELLQRCFLAALKYRVAAKKVELPLDVGEFYSRFVLACCPPMRRLDMKKTKYKKFSVFLHEINSSAAGPIMKTAPRGKGLDEIVEINWEHPLLSDFKRTDEVTEDLVQQTKARSQIQINEYFSVTEPVLPLFRLEGGLSRGDLLETKRVREIVTTYVKNRELGDKNRVHLRNDELLQNIVKHPSETIDWNTLMQKILSKMTKTFVIITADGRETVRKIELPKIVFRVETRSGNKKITLVNNLCVYGIDAKPFCHKVQIGIATSATILNDAPLCEGPQVIIQGNQVQFASELLTNEYGVDSKYMSGLELIPKKKRK